VPDTVARLRLALLAPVPSHLLEAKNRESTQEPESLSGGGGPIVVRKRQSPLARPIYATTPMFAASWLYLMTLRCSCRIFSAITSPPNIIDQKFVNLNQAA
uniref:hypothetical protein n=1 Tax=Burkholderia ambifaria TaxID=152480 RepID=UPI001ABB0295